MAKKQRKNKKAKKKKKGPGRGNRQQKPVFEPSQEYIRQECERIQQEWSPRERQDRLRRPRDWRGWVLPMMRANRRGRRSAYVWERRKELEDE